MSVSKARVYTDVNTLRPRDYWDYEVLFKPCLARLIRSYILY